MVDRKFEIRCDARPVGHLQVGTDALSVAVSQLIKQEGVEEMWQSVLVICEQGDDGVLTTRVIVCHPNWDQNLQIACIRSGVQGQGKDAPSLEINLDSTRL